MKLVQFPSNADITGLAPSLVGRKGTHLDFSPPPINTFCAQASAPIVQSKSDTPQCLSGSTSDTWISGKYLGNHVVRAARDSGKPFSTYQACATLTCDQRSSPSYAPCSLRTCTANLLRYEQPQSFLYFLADMLLLPCLGRARTGNIAASSAHSLILSRSLLPIAPLPFPPLPPVLQTADSTSACFPFSRDLDGNGASRSQVAPT